MTRRALVARALVALAPLAVALLPATAAAQVCADSVPQAGPSLAVRASRAVRALERVAVARERQRRTELYDPFFRKYAKRYFGVAVDWRLFKAQGMAESDLVPTATSRVGARGIMQLMPSTYQLISSRRPEFRAIDDPEWNIAAGVMHDRYLYGLWERDVHDDDRWIFMFASYNAGERTIARARRVARARQLDHARWSSIERIAPRVRRWRHGETLAYVRKIRANHEALRAMPGR